MGLWREHFKELVVADLLVVVDLKGKSFRVNWEL